MKIFASLLSLFLFISCSHSQHKNADKQMDVQHKHTNALINETSPYLLQHAHNPVNWYPWGNEAFKKAEQENKLILISIGYSACHWCHVMERESFENEEIAELMNENFVCIKVDREERPDVDQIYMNAVQLMQQRGGWPLNCFTLPNRQPIYGGTYFPPNDWKKVLSNLVQVYKDTPDKVKEYAEKLTKGIQQSELIPKVETDLPFSSLVIENAVKKWSQNFDTKEGGPNRSPKFPIPNNYLFLLRYAHLTGDKELMNHVKLTLDKIAFGGIYDQVGGGFARYSTDIEWKVPHFEKMLYDNGQLISLYSEAYQLTKDELYKHVVIQTLEFLFREMTSKEGCFYSALDADSEGEEGKFYIWNQEELKATLNEMQYDIVKEYYNINQKGLWEHGNYILLRKKNNEEIAKKIGITIKELEAEVESINELLLKKRSDRIRPGLDDKSLTSWNSIMAKGLVDAYLAFGEQKFLNYAIDNINFILEKQKRKDGGLNHSYKKGQSTINGYLEDYSFTIEALIGLYQATFEEKWLNEAKNLANYSIKHFYDSSSGMFFFTSDIDDPLIARKMEANDNVIPASNSSIANGLFLLGTYFEDQQYLSISEQMLKNIYNNIPNYASGYSNWSILALRHLFPFHEIAIVGKKADETCLELNQHYVANKLFIGSEKQSLLPLLENKLIKGQTTIYVCQNKTCKLPVKEVQQAIDQIKDVKN